MAEDNSPIGHPKTASHMGPVRGVQHEVLTNPSVSTDGEQLPAHCLPANHMHCLASICENSRLYCFVDIPYSSLLKL